MTGDLNFRFILSMGVTGVASRDLVLTPRRCISRTLVYFLQVAYFSSLTWLPKWPKYRQETDILIQYH
jgi:hypothetical protein